MYLGKAQYILRFKVEIFTSYLSRFSESSFKTIVLWRNLA